MATHLLKNPNDYLTPFGKFLRTWSIDEIPQLWSILIGDMSFVGPRPALFNQKDLIALRNFFGVSTILPGLTGWAQINGRDNLSIDQKVLYDVEYLNRMSFFFDLKIIFLTFQKVIFKSNILH